MDSYRAVLEVQKWGSAKEVLEQFGVVSNCWNRVSLSDELWITFFESESVPALSSCSSFRSGYQHHHCSPYSLYQISKQYIQVYNVRKKAWVRKVTLQRRLPTDTSSAYIPLPDGSLLICGGGEPIMDNCFRVDLLGRITVLGNLRKHRADHGIILVESTVYVFGGENDRHVLRSCEKLQWEYLSHISSSTWSLLGKMLTRRKQFKPCRSGDRILLLGGNTSSCESYSLLTSVFTALPLILDSSDVLAVDGKPYIHVFTSESHIVIDPRTHCSLNQHRCTKLSKIWGKQSGLLYESRVFFTFNNLVHYYSITHERLVTVAS